MKQLLRYQISGMVFIGWLLIFYFGSQPEGIANLIIKASNNSQLNNLTFSGLFSALPLGVFIHQISVLIKNCLLAKIFPEYDDFPRTCVLTALDQETNESAKYIVSKISNLNSFYYVRFDNGILAPFLSFLTAIFIFDVSVKSIGSEIIFSVFIALIICCYLGRISRELIWYQNKLGYKHKA